MYATPRPPARRRGIRMAGGALLAALLLATGCARGAVANHTPPSSTSAASSQNTGTSTAKPAGGQATSTPTAASGAGSASQTGSATGGQGGAPPAAGKTIPQTGSGPLWLGAGMALVALGAGAAVAGWRRLRTGD